jgi:hypothetical protein
MRLSSRYCLLAAGLATALSAAPATAAPTFGNDDLKGEYLFTVVEVRRDMLPGTTTLVTQYCVTAGTAIFDGVETMTGTGTQRCSVTGTGTVGDKPLYYAVNPDGSFLMSESPTGMTDPIHGQIVEHGRTLMIDGTTRTLPDLFSFSGIMMKR